MAALQIPFFNKLQTKLQETYHTILKKNRFFVSVFPYSTLSESRSENSLKFYVFLLWKTMMISRRRRRKKKEVMIWLKKRSKGTKTQIKRV